jgi:uncharacterized membrane protein
MNGSGLLRAAQLSLATTAWASALLFGLYILAFYALAMLRDDMQAWNNVLPRLYEPHTPVATAGIGLHFATGGVVLVLGAIQLVRRVREAWPALHRWIGRVYVACALAAGIGGLTFIFAKGTIGGTVMDLGFGLYGVLTVLAAVQTLRHARARDIAVHRAWAIRLFALAIGSWLYRMEYGFWLLLTGGLGHERGFSGPFDHVMAFFFYLPNLLVAEVLIRSRGGIRSPALRFGAAGVLSIATLFLLVGTYYFTRYYWGPAIVTALR